MRKPDDKRWSEVDRSDCDPVKLRCAVNDAMFVFTVKAIVFHPFSVFSGTSRGICRSGIGHLPLDTLFNGCSQESFSFF